MITDGIMDWWFGLAGWMVSLFPTNDELPADVFNFSMLHEINYFLPASELINLLRIMLALAAPFVTSSMVIWFLVGVLRGGATKA